MEKRTQEAEEFFQNEEDQEVKPIKRDNDDSDIEPSAVESTETPKEIEIANNDVAIDQLDKEENAPMELSGDCSIDESTTQNTETNQESTPKKDEDELPQVVELHTERTELDEELDNMIRLDNKPKRDLSNIPLINAPKLKGNSGMIIDFETNELKPREKTGVDELVERFVKNAVKKTSSDNDITCLG